MDVQQLNERALIPALNMPLATTVKRNEKYLREIFTGASDAVFRTLQSKDAHPLLVVYIDGLIDTKQLEETVLQPCLRERNPDRNLDQSPDCSEDRSQGRSQSQERSQEQSRSQDRRLGQNSDCSQEQSQGRNRRASETAEQRLDHLAGLLVVGDIKRAKRFDELAHALLNGSVAVLAHGCREALLANLPGWETRAIEEAANESGIRGPREGFTESLRTNTSMIRRRLRTPLLKLEAVTVGRISRTNVVIAYLEGLVDRSVLEEARRRIGAIRTDMVLDAHYVEEFIEDVEWSPFPQILNTERVDVVAASMFEGKVGILVDGSPQILVLPMTLWSGLQSSEDYYERSIYSIPIRWLRYLLLFMTVSITPTYVALTTFHPEMLPTNLLLSFAAAREPSPVPTAVEALVMDLLFEGLREAGVRLPRNVGPAISIVGGLVLGQAAVDAGIVSAPVVIVVAASGVASFTVPRYSFSFSFRLLRFPVLLLAALLGLYGITVAFLAVLIHLVNLQSFGVPYLAPVPSRSRIGWRDVVLPQAKRASFARKPASGASSPQQGHEDERRDDGS